MQRLDGARDFGFGETRDDVLGAVPIERRQAQAENPLRPRAIAEVDDLLEERRIGIERQAEVILKPRFAVALGMVFGELSTNAAKYGALSREGGRVEVTWAWSSEPDGRSLAITWWEIGGPDVQEPAHRGFGSRLIERSLAHELGGSASLAYPASGLVCTLRFRP